MERSYDNTPYQNPDNGAVVPGFALEEPMATPGDILAAGRWDNGIWTVELLRVASTDDNRDVAFFPDERYFQQPFLIAIGNNSKTPLESQNVPYLISNYVVNLSFEFLATKLK